MTARRMGEIALYASIAWIIFALAIRGSIAVLEG